MPPSGRKATRLAQRLFWSHTVLALILLAAVSITLWGLISMNAMLAEVKREHLADFEEEEMLHRRAWAIETAARHGALSCENPVAVGARIAGATDELDRVLRRYAQQVSPAMAEAAAGYLRWGRTVSKGDVCENLRDEELGRHRLQLDEELTDSWIGKLRELRIAITDKELAAQRMGTQATLAGLALGGLALFAAGLIARSMARGVTVPLSQIASQARRIGEGDFTPLPRIAEPYEVSELSHELERMRAGLAEVNQLKQAFLDSVSHDLRTPLAHMREALSLLTDGTVGPLTHKQQRVAGLALRACEREIRLVSALLDLSRIRSGRPLRMEDDQDVNDIIDRALESVHDTARSVGVTLSHQPNEQVPPLRVDSVLVETALSNVLGNAIAASPPGGKVSIECELLEQSAHGAAGHWLRIVVQDQGPGVPDALRSRIFDPFFTTKKGAESSGSGLGLPLAREMMAAHGGDLTLLEDPANGGRFALWLPLRASREVREVAQRSA